MSNPSTNSRRIGQLHTLSTKAGTVQTEPATIGVVASSTGGVDEVRTGLVEPLVERGYRVAVTLTPTAARWLHGLDELSRLEAVTGLPVRSEPRLPGEARPHPRIDAYALAPASANTVAKLALGIADNQALSVLCENVATTPMLVFPRVNAAHARQPSWPAHLESLRSVGAHLLYGEEVWPLHEPRSAEDSGRRLPWAAIVTAIKKLLR